MLLRDTEADRRAILYPLGSAQAEELALHRGLKPAIRQSLSRSALATQRERCERLGLHCVEIAADAGAVLIVARERGRAEAIAALERAPRDAGGAPLDAGEIAEHGRLLGFPACCVEAFAQHASAAGRGTLPGCRAALDATAGALAPRLNVLDPEVFHWVSWIPCAFDCAASRSYADRLAGLVAARYPVFVRRLDYALGAHRLVASDVVQVSLTGLWRGERLVVERAWPTAHDRRPGAPTLPGDLERAEALVAAVRRAGAVTVGGGGGGAPGGVVVAPLAPFGGDLHLYPFGGRSPGAAR